MAESKLDGLIAGRFGRVIKVVGSTAVVAGLLLFFGFLSQRALYGFAGLPQLSLDYTAMIEAGALALVESVGSTLESGLRLTFLILLMLLAIVFWMLRDQAGIASLTRSPWCCLSLQVVALAGIGSLLFSMVDAARLASPERRVELSIAAERALYGGSAADDLDLSEEVERLWATTYELQGLARVFLWLVDRELGPADTGSAEFDPEDRRAAGKPMVSEAAPHEPGATPRHALAVYGQPLRRTQPALEHARGLYAWLFLTTLLFAVGALGLIRWRLWLRSEPHTGPDALGARRPAPRTRFIGRLRSFVVRWTYGVRRVHSRRVLETATYLVEPLMIVSVTLCVALVPVAHGVLAQPRIGREEVIVRLKDTAECRGPASVPDSDSGDESSAAPDDTAAADTPASVTTRNCDRDELGLFGRSIDAYARALLDVMPTRPGNRDDEVNNYREATDRLFSHAIATGCADALVEVWLLRPHPAVHGGAPEAAEYFWERWREHQDRHDLRFGQILDYPRGTTASVLRLFQTVVDQTPFRGGRWTLRDISRDCIEEITVVPDLVQAHFDEQARVFAQEPKRPSEAQLYRYLEPASLDTALRLFDDPKLGAPTRGQLVTVLGTLAGTFSDYRPGSTERAIAALKQTLVGSPQLSHRAAAATALQRVGGVYAAKALAEALDEMPADVVARGYSSLITAAGHLSYDVELAVRALADADTDAEAGAGKLRQLRRISDRMAQFLRAIGTNDALSGYVRGAACTSLHASQHPDAGKSIQEAAELAIHLQDSVALGACVTSLGEASHEPGRALLMEMVMGRPGWVPIRTRMAAMNSLYDLGFRDGAEIVTAYRYGPDSTKFHAAYFLEDAWGHVVGQELIECAHDGDDEQVVEHCMAGLLFLDSNERGEQLIAQIVDLLEGERSDRVTAAICAALFEFDLRSGFEAAHALRAGVCGEVDHNRDSQQRDRWRAALNRLAERLIRQARRDGREQDVRDIETVWKETNLQAGGWTDAGSSSAEVTPETDPQAQEFLAIAGSEFRDGIRLARLFRNSRGMVMLNAAKYLEDAPSDQVGQVLLECLDEPSPDRQATLRCLDGLLLLDPDDVGGGIVSSLTDFIAREHHDDDLRAAGCRAVDEFAVRTGRAATSAMAYLMGQGSCSPGDLYPAEPDQRERWQRYLVDLIHRELQAARARGDAEVARVLEAVLAGGASDPG